MTGAREFFQTPKGKFAVGALLLLGIATLAYTTVYNSEGAVARGANDRVFIDAKTGKTFDYNLTVGDKIPVKSPSGLFGYPAEACYWTKDGKPKTEPTYVLLNEFAGKSGPTFCPDCGRLVVGHNPPADATRKAPPTQAEYLTKRPGQPTPAAEDNRDR